jgi:hypothetical protein
MMGFGLPDDNLHAPNEKFLIANFYQGIESIIRFLEIVGQAARTVQRKLNDSHERHTLRQLVSAAGFVLAGGNSSRMGSDKALALFGGIPLIQIALETLAEAHIPARIAGSRSDLGRFADEIPDTSPNPGHSEEFTPPCPPSSQNGTSSCPSICR